MAVCNVAYENLKEECKKKKKTANLEYSSLKLQKYFTCLYPNQARIVFKCRSQTLNIKSHLTYKYQDLLCRGCEIEEETLQHIVNCCMPESIDCEVCGLDEIDDRMKLQLLIMINRVEKFMDKVLN